MNRKYTNRIRYFLDDWLPPVLRENRLFMTFLSRLFHGAHFHMDFKREAATLTPDEMTRIYEKLGQDRGTDRYRETDMTEEEILWTLRNVVGPDVLEVGCGYGVLVERMVETYQVVATDFSPQVVTALLNRMKPTAHRFTAQVVEAERLPFANRFFDTVVCAHTLEHVVDFEKALSELIRVARQRVLIIVPCQRYYRYTIDYHLHFFPEPEQLLLRVHHSNARVEKITGDLCLQLDVSNSGARRSP